MFRSRMEPEILGVGSRGLPEGEFFVMTRPRYGVMIAVYRTRRWRTPRLVALAHEVSRWGFKHDMECVGQRIEKMAADRRALAIVHGARLDLSKLVGRPLPEVPGAGPIRLRVQTTTQYRKPGERFGPGLSSVDSNLELAAGDFRVCQRPAPWRNETMSEHLYNTVEHLMRLAAERKARHQEAQALLEG